MSALRASIARLPRFERATINIGEVAEFVHMHRPMSMRALIATIDALPESVPFHSKIVTGTALGGEVTVTLGKDGSYRSSGFMRATGALSFSYRITAIVRSVSGGVMVATVHSGKVFGSDTAGERQSNWDEIGVDQDRMKLIRNAWPDICAGKLEVRRSTELSGVLGSATDLIKDIALFVAAAQTLGASLAICLVIGSELGDAGVDVPGLGGVVGLGIVGGSLFIWGPLAIGPAIILGVAAGAVVDAMVKIRRLKPFEEEFARAVFGDSINFEDVRLTNLSGIGTRAFVAPTVDNTILVNIGNAFDAPTQAVFKSYPVKGQILIHELTHVWQIQHRSLTDGYVPGWLCEGIVEKTQGDSAYKSGEPGPPWSSFGIESQASIVDRWFAGTTGKKSLDPDNSSLTAMDLNSRYFAYINNNIRLGIA